MDAGLVTVLVAAFGAGGAATTFLTLCFQRKWQRDDRIDALVDAQKVTMIHEVRSLGRQYLEAGEISLEDKETVKDMYDAYKRLGGNGHLETVMTEINHLKVV